MIKQLFILLIILALPGFCYLPVYMNSTPQYNVSNTLYADASATTINLTSFTGVNLTCVESLSTHIISSTNSSDIWNGVVDINASGSWNCTAEAYNNTDVESNSSVFTITCPSTLPVNYLYICYSAITLTLDQDTTYFDVGDNVTFWASETNSTMTANMWLYSSDNLTYQFMFSILKDKWYVYYTVKQKQEILVVQSFTATGVTTGIGEFTLTYNPNPPTASWVENLYTQAGYLLLIFAGIILLLVALVIAGPLVLGFVLATVKGER